MATLTADQLLEAFEKMTVLELSEFKKKFEDRFGVTAAAPVAMAAAPAAAAEAAPVAEEQTEFSATITEIGPNKIPVIKVVRELTGLGLKEAKDLVDATPKAVKENAPRPKPRKSEEARAAGAKVELATRRLAISRTTSDSIRVRPRCAAGLAPAPSVRPRGSARGALRAPVLCLKFTGKFSWPIVTHRTRQLGKPAK